MRLEIRDVEDTTVYEIGPDGAVLGRERAKTDISLRDESVSKRHARIFPDDGAWLLEDLNSSNGTYIDEERITGPVPITKGSVFALAQRKFEVVYIEGPNAPPRPPIGLHNGANGGLRPLHDTAVPPLMGASSDPYASHPGSSFDDGNDRGSASVFAAFPRALAYYLVHVPLTLLNPVGAVRKATQEQPVQPMSRSELAVFAMPAGAVAFSVLALVVSGAFASAPLAGALVGAVLGTAVAAIGGFLLHPVLDFLVELFRGTSDERSRTNHGVQAFALLIIVALTQGLGAFLSVLTVSFVGLVGPFLLTFVSLIVLYFAYRWAVEFRLATWVRWVVLGLGTVWVLVTVAGLVQRARGEFEAPGLPVAADQSATTGDGADPSRRPSGGPEGAPAGRPVPSPKKAAPPPATTRADAARAVSPAKAPLSPPGASRNRASAAPTLRSGAPAGRAAGPAGGLPPIVTAEHPLGETPFVRFLAKRRAIERAVNDRPELLERRSVRRDYERLWRKTYNIREKYRKKRGERWKRDKILARRKDQEVFEATHKEVDRLYDRIFP